MPCEEWDGAGTIVEEGDGTGTIVEEWDGAGTIVEEWDGTGTIVEEWDSAGTIVELRWTPKVHRGEFETTGVIYFGYNMIYYGSSPQTILDDIGELWTCGAGSKWSDAYPEVDI
jgi:hypothetical protein